LQDLLSIKKYAWIVKFFEYIFRIFAFFVHAEKIVYTEVEIEKYMLRKIEHKKITWLDFESPTADDVEYLQENFNIHPTAIEEFVTPTFRPKATQYEHCLFLTIHIPLYDAEARTTYPGEVDIILTKTHLITGHREYMYQFSEFFSDVQRSEGKKMLHMGQTTAHLLYSLLELLLDSCFPKLDNITRKIESIEREVFSDNEKKMVREISFVKRDILNFRRTLMPQRSVLESLTQKPCVYIPKDLYPYYQDLIGTNIRLWNTLQSNKETIESLEETNESLLSNKLNEKMRVITLFTSILVPVSLYANIVSMNVPVPFNGNPDGFWFHLAGMGTLAVCIVLFFRWRKWV
jgi:magnesium transporter